MDKLLEEHGLEKSTIDLKINIPSKYGHFRYERIGNEVVKTDLECTKRSVSKKEEIDLKWPDIDLKWPDMINKAVTDGFFDRCTRIIERKGESADLKTKKRPAE